MASLVERNEAGLVDAGRSRGQPRRRGHDDEPRLSACPARLRMRGLCGRGGTQALSQVPSSRASFWRDSEQSRNTQPVSRQRGSSHEHGEVARASDGSGRRGGLRAARRHPCGLPGCLRGREERERHHAAWTERRFADGDPSGRHDLRDPFLEDGRGRDVPVLDGGGGGVQSNEGPLLDHWRAIAPDDVWTVGYANNPNGPQYSIQTLALHWDGSAWSIVATPNAPMDWSRLYGVAATSSNDVWAVGASRDVASVPGRTLIEHWDGSAWSIVPSPSPGAVVNELRAVATLSTNDAWAVGFCAGWYRSSTLILPWDGGSWGRVPSPTPNAELASNELYGIAAFSADDIWAVGVSGNSSNPYAPLAVHWDGAAWSAISTDGLGGGGYGSFFRSVSGTSSGDLLAVGATVFDAGLEGGIRHVAFAAHWDGAAWTQITDFTFLDPGEYYSSSNFYGVTTVASDFGWVVGEASGEG